MVRVFIYIMRAVVWFSIRPVGSVVQIEGDVQEIDHFYAVIHRDFEVVLFEFSYQCLSHSLGL